jgi:N-acetylglucosaminyldiphosphoundecaprenol N-acetyl-beta-D-mannosaminyltransferase
MTNEQHYRFDVLGTHVSAIDIDEAARIIEQWIAQGTRSYVCVTGAHGVMESRRRPDLRAIHNAAGMVTPDGMPLVWFARLLGHSRTRRVYGPDLMRRLSAVSEQRGYRQFYYGGGHGVADQLCRVMLQRHPSLRIVGTLCPPFRPLTQEEDRAAIERINTAEPDIVWVGLSTPKQELWMAAHRVHIAAPVMIGVGAAFDFLAGTKRQAPLWAQRNGLEWAFRLCSEPRRLLRRYSYIVPTFGILALREIARHYMKLPSRHRRSV